MAAGAMTHKAKTAVAKLAKGAVVLVGGRPCTSVRILNATAIGCLTYATDATGATPQVSNSQHVLAFSTQGKLFFLSPCRATGRCLSPSAGGWRASALNPRSWIPFELL